MKRLLNICLFIVAAGWFVCSMSPGYAEETLTIRVVTSDFPPYNYQTEDGSIAGLSTDVVQAVLGELDMTAPPAYKPWARIYKETQNEANVLLYSITRTPAREALFKWVGIIAPADYSLWALKSRADIRIQTIEDAKQYRIGTSLNDVVEQYLYSRECPHIDSVSGNLAYERNVRKLFADRIDLWGVATLPGSYILQKMQAEDRVVRVFLLRDIPNDGLYMAFGPKTADEVVEQFRTALESIKQKGIYQQLLEKYGVDQFYPAQN